jgi:hypothetical protein
MYNMYYFFKKHSGINNRCMDPARADRIPANTGVEYLYARSRERAPLRVLIAPALTSGRYYNNLLNKMRSAKPPPIIRDVVQGACGDASSGVACSTLNQLLNI